MTMADRIALAYPAAKPGVDFCVQDDGGGPFLSYWDVARLGPRPSDAEIAALPEAVALEKARLSRRIDDDAEAVRLRYITPGSGMAMVYQEKFAQAQAVAQMGADAANTLAAQEREAQFPTLSASVGIEAGTLYDCAQLVLARYAVFAQASLAIERSRLAGKAAVSAAQDITAMRAAYEAITWPTP